MSRRRSTVCMAPIAVASDGAVLVNLAHATAITDPKKLVEFALAQGGALFVGVLAKPKEVKFVCDRLDDPFAEVVALVFGAQGHRRPRAR